MLFSQSLGSSKETGWVEVKIRLDQRTQISENAVSFSGDTQPQMFSNNGKESAESPLVKQRQQ